MYQIIEDELERLKEMVQNNTMDKREKFCDYWDFEDEYSHNQIDEAMEQFLYKANEYFDIEKIPYRATYGVGNVFVEFEERS